MNSQQTVASFLSIDGDRVRVPRSAFDHAGFRAWAASDAFPDQFRAAYVGGEVILEMSPEELEGHNKVKTALTAVLFQLVDENDLGELYSDRTLLTHTGVGLSCEPDLLFVSWEPFESGRVRLVEKANREDRYIEVEGAPDVVVEIVSDSSVRKDEQLLRESYARAGIPEYWLIDARGDTIRFEILQLSDGDYTPSAPGDQPQTSTVFDRRFRLERAHNRAGRFRYRASVS